MVPVYVPEGNPEMLTDTVSVPLPVPEAGETLSHEPLVRVAAQVNGPLSILDKLEIVTV